MENKEIQILKIPTHPLHSFPYLHFPLTNQIWGELHKAENDASEQSYRIYLNLSSQSWVRKLPVLAGQSKVGFSTRSNS